MKKTVAFQTYMQLQHAEVECGCATQVRPGDVLIVGSDGLWDNLSTKQILEEVRLIELHSTP